MPSVVLRSGSWTALVIPSFGMCCDAADSPLAWARGSPSGIFYSAFLHLELNRMTGSLFCVVAGAVKKKELPPGRIPWNPPPCSVPPREPFNPNLLQGRGKGRHRDSLGDIKRIQGRLPMSPLTPFGERDVMGDGEGKPAHLLYAPSARRRLARRIF